MFDTTLLVVTRLMCDHYMGTSSKDEMYSLIYKSNLSLQTQLCHIIESVIACTYYEIIIYVRRNNILHCWYIKVLYVLVVPIMSGDKLAHETISSCHIGFKGFLKAVFQILSDKVHRCIHPNITISSTLTRAWRGFKSPHRQPNSVGIVDTFAGTEPLQNHNC